MPLRLRSNGEIFEALCEVRAYGAENGALSREVAGGGGAEETPLVDEFVWRRKTIAPLKKLSIMAVSVSKDLS
jgi:hypothetical protein